VLFDNDGVLVDSEPLHRIAWEKVFRPRGVVVSDADYTWSVGRRDVTFAAVVIDKFGLPDEPEALRDEKRRHLLKMVATESRTFEGLPRLVRRLAEARQLGVVSSAMLAEVKTVLKRFGLSQFVGAIVTNEDVARHKPHPEPYLTCADRLGVEPQHCTAFEDSISGIESAKAAGMRVIGFSSTFPPHELRGADAVIESMADTDAVVELVESLERRSAHGLHRDVQGQA